MPDIATTWDVDNAVGDWTISAPRWPLWVDQNGDSIRDQIGRAVGNAFIPGQGLVTGSDLYTAVLISLFTDAAAGPDDIIPDGSRDPRGWWGDPSIGSKLWLLMRSKATSTVLALAKTYIEQALQWLIDDGVVAKIEVTTEWTKRATLGALIVFHRSDGAHLALNFSQLWETA